MILRDFFNAHAIPLLVWKEHQSTYNLITAEVMERKFHIMETRVFRERCSN